MANFYRTKGLEERLNGRIVQTVTPMRADHPNLTPVPEQTVRFNKITHSWEEATN